MSLSFNEDAVFVRVKRALMTDTGLEGLKNAVRTFRAMDTNADRELSPKEWRDGLRKLGVKLTDQEAQYLFVAFDANRDGLVSIDEFVRNLVGQLNHRRTVVVGRAYDSFCSGGGNGEGGHNNSSSSANNGVTVDALCKTFNASSSPLVARGMRTEEAVMRDFLRVFDHTHNPDGVITREEFFAYYAAVSATVPFDDAFEAMVLKAWGVDSAQAPRLASTARDWSQAPGGVDPLLLTEPLLHTKNLNTKLAETNRGYATDLMRRNHAPFLPNPSVKPDYISTSKHTFINFAQEDRTRGDPLSSRKAQHAATMGALSPAKIPTGNPLLDAFRRKILARAAESDEGFAGLRRSFRVMDMSRDHRLQRAELESALQRYRISVTPVELQMLWNYADRNTDGYVTVTEFLRLVRGDTLNDRRREMVDIAFDRLDRDQSGKITLDELADRYDLAQHPAVVSGRLTREEALQSFVDSWDRNRDGTITRAEWYDYYEDLSAGIDDDNYFELMIRNAWHISGGSGAAANTTCRRVLATFADGSERVVEVKNDIGVDYKNPSAVKQRLANQGVPNVVSFKLAH